MHGMAVFCTFMFPRGPGPAGWPMGGDLQEQAEENPQHSEGHVVLWDLWQSEVTPVWRTEREREREKNTTSTGGISLVRSLRLTAYA